MEESQAKRFDRMLGMYVDSAMMSNHPVPTTATWGAKFSAKEVWGAKAPYFYIGYPPYGCMEARVIVNGAMVILGVASSAVPGDSIKMKRQALYESSAEQLQHLVETKGFIAEVMENHVALIPSGFVVMMLCPTKGTTGIRWQANADEADKLRVISQTTELLNDFPETKASATGYGQLLDFLKSQ